MTRLQQAKSVDLYHYLIKNGFKPSRENSRRAYFTSPKRSESNPSMMVDKVKNRWNDYGEQDASGDIIDFVEWVDGCTTGQAINKILGEENLPQYHKPDIEIIREKPIEVLNVIDDITTEPLIRYLEEERGIPLEVGNKYTKEVEFQFATSRYAKHVGIGLPNDLGGWAIRGVWFKGSTKPAGISTTSFDQGTEISLFEGLFDFLTYVLLHGQPNETCVVLNSLVHIHMMDTHLRAYDKINAFFDNDGAGDEKVDWLLAGDYPVEDMRHLYSEYNDYNDFLIATYTF